MQNGELQDFDLKLRSMLADAEVKAPSRLWSGISARLDAAGAAARPVIAPVWKWTGIAFAAAAALAAAFLLTGTADRSSKIGSDALAVVTPVTAEDPVIAGSQDAHEGQDVAARNPEVAEGKDIAGRQGAVVAASASNGKARSSAGRTSIGAAAASVAPVAGSDDALKATPEETVPAGAAASEVSASADAVPSDASASGKTVSAGVAAGGSSGDASGDDAVAGQEWTDPFAALEKEDTRRASAGPVSLYVNSSIGGNDSEFGEVSVLRSRASVSATVPTGTSIREKSVSLYGVPLTFGAGIRIPVLPSLSVGTGLSWSMLTRSFQGTYTEVAPGGTVTATFDADVLHTMHYIGIPINIYYGIINAKSMKFYVWGGGMAEGCLSNKYTVRNTPKDIIYRENVDKMQLSAGIGLGVEFRLADNLGLYLDPSARYYFRSNQPKNIHTEKPFMVSFEAGLRFSL